MTARQSTQLPSPPRRRRGRDWTITIARVLCVVLGLLGVVPIAAAALARSPALNAWAARESARLLEEQGLHAGYAIEVKLVPLALELTHVRVSSTDGKGDALTSDRISARPRIFALLAGKLVLDQIEIDEPAVRLVIKDGQPVNVPLHIPKSSGKATVIHAPFSVFAVTAASVDLTLDDAHLVARDIDVDLTTDDDGPEGSSFEISTRVGHTTFSRRREYTPRGQTETAIAVDDDTLCTLDARVRYEPHLVLVRRLSAEGSADLDVASDTAPRCDLPADDKRKVEVDVSHLRVVLPPAGADPERMPHIDGHVRARAPVGLAEREVTLPQTDGWIGVDADVRYAEDTTIPELDGHFEAHSIQLAKYRFASEIQADLDVKKDVVRAPKVMVRIADGVANLTDVQVEPLAKGVPLKAKFDASGVSFFALMRDLGISPHPHVTWDIKELHAPSFKGTLVPLHLDADLTGRTANFEVADVAIDDPAHHHLLGFKEATLATHVAVRATALEFSSVHSQVGTSEIDGGFCSIGFDNRLRVDVPKAKIELPDISPLADIPLAGDGNAEVHVSGLFNDPHLEGDVTIGSFALGDIPFGNVTAAHVSYEGTTVDLKDVQAVKGKSAYGMPEARLEFGGKAAMELNGVAATSGMDLRDFLALWHFDDDPRFDDLDATLATRASIHLAMGGPEDACGGGFVDVRAGVHATSLKLYGEQFDDGDVDLEFRQLDRLAGIQGSEVNVRAATLHKFHPPGGEPSGSVLASGRIARGGALHANVVMEAIPLYRIQALGDLRNKTEGTVSGLANVDGTIDRFTTASDIDVTPARLRGTPIGASHLHVAWLQTSPPTRVVGKTRCGGVIGPAFDKEAFLHDTQTHGQIAIDGDLAGGALHLENLVVTRAPRPLVTGGVTLHELDLGALTRIIKPPDATENDELAVGGAPKDEAEGTLSGELTIDRAQVGELEHAKARFAPASLTFSRGPNHVVMRPTKEVIALDEDRLVVPALGFDLQAARGFRGAFTLHGNVNHVTTEGDLALAVDLSPIDLGLLAGVVPKVERATGQLTGAMQLAGRVRSPHLEGDLHVTGGEVQIHGLPSIVSDVAIDVQANADEVRIERAQAKFAGGTVSVSGTMPLKQLLLGTAEAHVRARGVHLAPVDGVAATMDADLTLAVNGQGDAAAKLPRVSGDVMLTQFDYTRPINLTSDLSSLGGRAKRTVVDSYDPALDAMTFELSVRAKAPLRLRNNLVEAQLAIDSGALTVSGTNQRVGLRGDLKALPGGRFHLRGNDFDVRQAFIRFDDPTRIAPNVDVVAVTEYRRYSDTTAQSAAGAGANGIASSGGVAGSVWHITVHAYGDADNLHLDMTSDPPLSQEDIVLLLTIGMTRAEVDQLQAGSLGTSAALEALATVSGADKAVKSAIPIIDDFRFGSAYDPRSGRTEPQVTVGKRLTENVRASVSSGLTSDQDREVRSILEWRLNQRLSVQGSYDNINDVSSTVGNVGVDLRWRLEFE